MDTLNELFQEQIRDLYSAEQQLLKALPKMAKKASNPELKKGIEKHIKQTESQKQRLDRIAEMWEFKPTGKKCKAMEGLIEEGEEVLSEKGEPTVLDLAIISAAQKVEHYEISGYGTARAIAERLECQETVDLLQESLDEESETDESLTKISEGALLAEAPVEEGEEGEEEEEEEEEESEEEEDEDRDLANM